MTNPRVTPFTSSPPQNPIIDIDDDYAIDLSKVVCVGPEYDEPHNRKYNVSFTNGFKLEVYTGEQSTGYRPHMDRKDFVAMWKRYRYANAFRAYIDDLNP